MPWSLRRRPLYANYIGRLSAIYERSFLHQGIERLLLDLQVRGIPLAVASSCSRAEIELVLQKFNLAHCFEIVISGEDVAQSKPHPAIYLLAKAHFPEYNCYVVEDSDNGLQAALSAGLTTIFYNPNQRDTDRAIHYEIPAHQALPLLLDRIQQNCVPIAQTSQIIVHTVHDCPIYSKAIQAQVEALWQAACAKKPLFNGSIVCYHSHQKRQGVLHIQCFVHEYKYFLAQLTDPSLDLGLSPIGVSGLLIDPQQNTLIGQRQGVTQYDGYYELMPSGSIEADKKTPEGYLDYTAQLLTELEEETGIAPTAVQQLVPFCLLYDTQHQVYDIGCKVYLNAPLVDLVRPQAAEEYSNSKIISLATCTQALQFDTTVPTSWGLLQSL